MSKKKRKKQPRGNGGKRSRRKRKRDRAVGDEPSRGARIGEVVRSLPFASEVETRAALVAVSQWLPVLVKRFEEGIEGSGHTIEKRLIVRDEHGAAEPVIVIRDPDDETMELFLRNSIEEFLTLDRDERPARFDPQLMDPESAEEKLRGIVDGRIAMLKAIRKGKATGKITESIQKLAGQFERIRITEQEP